MQVQTEEVIMCVCLGLFMPIYIGSFIRMCIRNESIFRDQTKNNRLFDELYVLNHVYGHFDTLAQTQTKRKTEGERHLSIRIRIVFPPLHNSLSSGG